MQRAEAATGEGVWAPQRRRLTVGLVTTVTLVAFESLSVATVLPVISRQLGDLRLYGWVFSAFFLASLVGIAAAGGLADRRGLEVPLAGGLVLFAAGLVVGGLAPDMPVLVGGRFLQGLGAGAVPAAAYTAIGRGYPPSARPRMFAVLSTAWVVPGLVGPTLAAVVAGGPGWRWVFLGLVPVVAVAALLCVPALRAGPGLQPRAADPADDEQVPMRLGSTLLVAAGAAAVLGGLSSASWPVAAGLAVVGIGAGLPALRRLLPPGALRVRPGLPAAVGVRGLLTFGFFAADAYVPYTVIVVRHHSTAFGGLALTVATMTWTAGSWIQARLLATVGPRRLVAAGLLIVAVGAALTSTVLIDHVPVALAAVGWGVAGLGIGMSYSPISVTALDRASPGAEGRASASVQLTDVLGTALGTGTAGALVALGHRSGWNPRSGVALVFAMSMAVSVAGIGCARRIPRRLSGPDG
ncbi:MFS transporter [Acidiferrimicrobium sp. IK]|uniref:MFS transporter n=1 Tax=Acidiferrimicrobium sp. IK TaxID=2871700 RepID=UPI0021CB74D5|nr:MFS transporter [Acidiferrimicrobium sp. IK]MCU4185414.1 MFS transporter [Acidiferrimicrobium sp. IK]